MDLTVLVDNNCKTNYYLLGEPGLSFLLENDYQKALEYVNKALEIKEDERVLKNLELILEKM